MKRAVIFDSPVCCKISMLFFAFVSDCAASRICLRCFSTAGTVSATVMETIIWLRTAKFKDRR